MTEVEEMLVRMTQQVASQCVEIEQLRRDKETLLALINSDCPPPADYSDLGVWVNEMAKDYAACPPVGNTGFSMWLHEWLCDIRAARQAGIVPSEEDDIDE